MIGPKPYGYDDDEGQFYANPNYFDEYDSEEYVPPGVDRETYIDPNWNWFDKMAKRLAPYAGRLFLATYALFVAATAPSMYRWATENPEESTDEEEENKEENGNAAESSKQNSKQETNDN